MTVWAAVVQGLYWLLLADAVLAMLAGTFGLAWCAVRAASAVRHAWRSLRAGPVHDGPATVPLRWRRRTEGP